MTSLIETLRSKASEAREIADKATEGPWTDMFIGGPLNPEKIDVYTAGREGSHHIQIAIEDKYVKSGFFKEGDSAFIAASRTLIPQLCQLLDEAAEELKVYEGPRLTSAGATIKHYQTENARLKKALRDCLNWLTEIDDKWAPLAALYPNNRTQRANDLAYFVGNLDAELSAILKPDGGIEG